MHAIQLSRKVALQVGLLANQHLVMEQFGSAAAFQIAAFLSSCL